MDILNKKKILIVLAISAALVVPFSVFAATSDVPAAKTIRSFFGIDVSKLTDNQKSDIKTYNQKMADLQKEFINKMVSNGTLTKEQGDAQLKRIDEMLKNGGDSAFLQGFGKGFKQGLGQGFMGQRGFGLFGLDFSKLTDKQKSDLLDSYKNIAGIQKEMVSKMISNGFLSKEKGDDLLKKIDSMVSDIEKNGFSKGVRDFLGIGGLNFFNMRGVDTSKLTDQQKADFKDFSAKLSQAQKDLISKMVSNGAITKEQGDSAAKLIDQKSKNVSDSGLPNGLGMGKGHFGGGRRGH